MTRRTRWGWLVVALVVVAACLFLFVPGLTGRSAAIRDSILDIAERRVSRQETQVGTQAAGRAGERASGGAGARPDFLANVLSRAWRGRVFGKVVLGYDGALPSETTVSLHLVDLESPLAGEGDTLVSTAKAGADGAFEFTVAERGAYTVVAKAEKYSAFGFASFLGEVPVGLTLHLVESPILSGRVENSQGEGVAGAQVFLAAWDSQGTLRFVPRDLALPSRTVSDTDGSFALEILKPAREKGAGYRLAVKADGFATYLSGPFQAGAAGIEISLARGGTVSGRVVDSVSGAALADKVISLESELSMESARTTSDGEGRFTLEGIPAGQRRLRLVDPELVVTQDSAEIEARDGAQTENVTLVVVAGGRVSGRVYDQVTGEGWQETVFAYSEGSLRPSAWQTTNARGEYSITGLPPGGYRIGFLRPRGDGEGYGVAGGEDYLIEVRVGSELRGVDFLSPPPSRLFGRVVDEAGVGIAGAGIGRGGYRSAGDGSFVLTDEPQREYGWSASKSGYAYLGSESDRIPQHAAAVVSGIRLVLGSESSISGTVVDESGNPIGDVGLRAQRTSRPYAGAGARSAEDGSFQLRGLAPGEYEISIPRHGRRMHGQGPSVSVAKGVTVGDVRVVALREDRNPTVSGQVTDEEGAAVFGAKVTLGEYSSASAYTDDAGRFAIRCSDGQTEPLSVTAERYLASPPVEVPCGAVDVNIVLKRQAPAVVRGLVLSKATGEPVTSFRVHSWRNEPRGSTNRELRLVFAPDGRFRIEVFGVGETNLLIEAAGYARGDANIEDGRDGQEPREVVIRLDDGALLEGRVVDSSGNPLGGAQLDFYRPGQGSSSVATRADGSFRLSPVAPGRIEIQVQHPDWAPTSTSVEVKAGSENRVKIRMEKGGSVRGRVTLDGKPAANMLIHYASGNFSASATTGARGRYEIHVLPEGKGQVCTFERGSGEKKKELTMHNGEIAEINFDLVSGTAVIEGTAYFVAGQPTAAGTEVSYYAEGPEGFRESFTTTTDAAGRFRFERVIAGIAGIVFSHGGQTPVRERFYVAEGEHIVRDLTLPGGAIRVKLEGVVRHGSHRMVYVLRGTPEITESQLRSQKAIEATSVAIHYFLDGFGKICCLDAGTYTLVSVNYANSNVAIDMGEPAVWEWGSQVVEVAEGREIFVSSKL